MESTPLPDFQRFTPEEMQRRASEFQTHAERRRSVREFSTEPVPPDVIESCVRAAASSPSGANQQPWHFVVVSSAEIKQTIRVAAEQEENEFYHGDTPQDWLKAVEQLGTDDSKPYLEQAPHLIVVFAQRFWMDDQNRKRKNYYVAESVGIATGVLISALHHAGLATLTHTPSPMRFLNSILNQPENYRPYLILVAGFPADKARVPKIERKPFEDVASFV